MLTPSILYKRLNNINLGGDDRRVLLWDVNKVTRKGHTAPCQMKTEHLSNIFCTIFDNETKHIFSAGI